jgi:hypothetical protein
MTSEVSLSLSLSQVQILLLAFQFRLATLSRSSNSVPESTRSPLLCCKYLVRTVYLLGVNKFSARFSLHVHCLLSEGKLRNVHCYQSFILHLTIKEFKAQLISHGNIAPSCNWHSHHAGSDSSRALEIRWRDRCQWHGSNKGWDTRWTDRHETMSFTFL